MIALFYIGLERLQQLESREIDNRESPDRRTTFPPHFIGDLCDMDLVENDNLHLELRVTYR